MKNTTARIAKTLRVLIALSVTCLAANAQPKAVELKLRDIACGKTTEAGADEVFLLIFGTASDGRAYGERYPGNYPDTPAGHWDMNDDTRLGRNKPTGDSHVIGDKTLFRGTLAPGESWNLAVAIMEEDGGNTLMSQALASEVLARTGNPFAIAAGALLGLLSSIGAYITDTDDYIGSFSVQVANNNGNISQTWRPIDRVLEHQNSESRCCRQDPACCGDRIHEFMFVGDGSKYHGWFQLVY